MNENITPCVTHTAIAIRHIQFLLGPFNREKKTKAETLVRVVEKANET
jgi:hypothetical protein